MHCRKLRNTCAHSARTNDTDHSGFFNDRKVHHESVGFNMKAALGHHVWMQKSPIEA